MFQHQVLFIRPLNTELTFFYFQYHSSKLTCSSSLPSELIQVIKVIITYKSIFQRLKCKPSFLHKTKITFAFVPSLTRLCFANLIKVKVETAKKIPLTQSFHSVKVKKNREGERDGEGGRKRKIEIKREKKK